MVHRQTGTGGLTGGKLSQSSTLATLSRKALLSDCRCDPVQRRVAIKDLRRIGSSPARLGKCVSLVPGKVILNYPAYFFFSINRFYVHFCHVKKREQTISNAGIGDTVHHQIPRGAWSISLFN